MEARYRLVRVAVGQVAFGVVVALALIAFVLATLNGLPRTTHPSVLIAPLVVTSPEQPQNVYDRNEANAQAARSK
jgi:hypothetical protein